MCARGYWAGCTLHWKEDLPAVTQVVVTIGVFTRNVALRVTVKV